MGKTIILGIFCQSLPICTYFICHSFNVDILFYNIFILIKNTALKDKPMKWKKS